MAQINKFQVIFTDARGRDYKATYTRGARGQFAKLTMLERHNTNGIDHYWELYRTAMHGDLEHNTKAFLKQHAELVRYQA